MSFLGLDIASSGVAADEAVLNTTAENLANIQTPGYAQERVQLLPQTQASASGVGEGVLVGAVSQQSSALYEEMNLVAQANASAANETQTIQQAAQSAFPEPGPNGLSAQLSQTWTDLSALATTPNSTSAAASVVQDLTTVANTLNGTFSQLQSTATQLGVDLTGSSGSAGLLAQANQLIGQIGKLNVSIVAGNAGGLDTNSLIDERRAAVAKLAGMLGVRTSENADGSLNVSSGGISLVSGGTTTTLVTSGSAATGNLTVGTSAGDTLAAGGQIGAILTGVNSTIPGYLGQLSSVADSLASNFNTLQSGGVSANGTPGPTSAAAAGWTGATLPPIFVDGGSSTGYTPGGSSAATISVSPALLNNPSLLATASGSSTAGQSTIDATTVQAMAALGSAANGPDTVYGQLVGQVGSDTQTANAQATTASSLATAASANLSSVEGVATNQETVTMLAAQQAFQATAQVINAMDTAFNSLLSVTL